MTDREKIENLSNEYVKISNIIKDNQIKKKELEENIKFLMEKNEMNVMNTAEYKMTYSTVERKIPVKANDIFESFHRQLLENSEIMPIAETIMENVREMIKQNEKKSTVVTLRVSKN